MADAQAELQSMIRGLKEKTGKDIDAWVKVAKGSGETTHGKIVAFLKSKHDLGHGYANLVAHMHLKSGAINSDAAELVDRQFAGAKAALRPWYDALVKHVLAFGKDVELAPKNAYVSLRRSKQFALIQPSTATRLDVGIVLKAVAPGGRLEVGNKWNAMCTHRVRVESSDAIDKELIAWLRQAYDAS